jgi:hypothetical protein
MSNMLVLRSDYCYRRRKVVTIVVRVQYHAKYHSIVCGSSTIFHYTSDHLLISTY